MNAPICPANHVLVQIDKRFKEDIVTESGLTLYQDTSYRPEWHVTVTGKVVSVPKVVDGSGWASRARIEQQVQVGDLIAFSYLVVFDMAHVDDRDEVFYEDPMGNPFLTQYSNRLEQKILIRYNPEHDRFDVAAFEKNGYILKIKEGLTLLEKDDYLGEFKFAESNEISYNNLLELNDQEYWMVDYAHIIAINRGGAVAPLSGKAILDLPNPQPENSNQTKAGLILLSPVQGVTPARNAAALLAIGEPLIGANPLDCQPGDTVAFDERFVEHYELWGKDVLVVPQSKLLAKL